MKKLHQNGFTHHIILLFIGIVTIAIAGIVFWRIRESSMEANASSGCATYYRLAPTTPNTSHLCVARMKKLLSYAQSGVGTTWVYDSATIEKVKAFQRSKGLTVDGIVGTKQTWPALCSLSNTSTGYKVAKADAGCSGASAVTTGWSLIGDVTTQTNAGKVTIYACRVKSEDKLKYKASSTYSSNVDSITVKIGGATPINLGKITYQSSKPVGESMTSLPNSSSGLTSLYIRVGSSEKSIAGKSVDPKTFPVICKP